MSGPAPRRFKSVKQAQIFLGAHAAVSNLFNLGRHLVRAGRYRNLREGAFEEWDRPRFTVRGRDYGGTTGGVNVVCPR